MYRRQAYDRLDPRNVVPSRHTLFIRGLPGSTDVAKVREYFSNQTGSKCSVEFFSTSEDKKRFSVAIRFKSHEMAREMLGRYNSKSLFGYPVELTWFKDLKKARLQMFGDQRQGSARQFQRNNFRGSVRSGQDRRNMHSPMGSYDNNRRRGRGSSSSGGSGIHRYKDIDRNRGSMSRSRSYTGSSSRSASRSRGSRSHSKNRASLVSNRNDSPRARESDFATRSYDDQRSPRNRVHSTSSSRSSEIRLRNSFRSNHKDQNSGFNHGTSNCSPSNFISHPRCYSGSPSMDDRNFSAYTNAVAPDVNGSLVSDLIQPKYQGRQRQKSQTMDRGFNQRSRHSSRSSSIGSVASSENVITMSRNRSPHKRPHSNSSSLNEPVNSGQFRRSQQDDNQNQEAIDSVKRKKIKPTLRQRDSISSDENRIVSRPVSVESIDGERPNLIRPCTPNVDRFIKSTRQEDATQKRRLNTKSIHKIDTVIITEDKNDLKTNSRSPQLSVRRSKRWQPQDHEENETNKTSTNKKSELKKSKRKCPNSEESEKNEIVNQDLIDLIQTRKDALTQDYKRDCEAFTTVVRTLISKDQDLESRLMPMLKEILHERGHRCIDDLRLFIADHQPTDSSAKSTKHLFKDVNNAS